MDKSEVWRRFFHEWPAGVPQRGVLVTSFGDQITFVGFVTSENLLVIERQAPDSMGARKVILPFGSVDAVKVVDPIKMQVLIDAGFRQTPAR